MADSSDLISRTLFHLRATGVGQTDAAEDAEVVQNAIQGKLDELSKIGVMPTIDPDDFDDMYLNWLAICLANDLATGFGSTIDANAVAYAEKRLRMLNESAPSGNVATGLYY